MQDILSVLRHFSAILFKFINQGISLTLCYIHFWKALDVRIDKTLAFLLFGDFWKAQNFKDSARLKWRLYLRVRPRNFDFQKFLKTKLHLVIKNCYKLIFNCLNINGKYKLFSFSLYILYSCYKWKWWDIYHNITKIKLYNL